MRSRATEIAPLRIRLQRTGSFNRQSHTIDKVNFIQYPALSKVLSTRCSGISTSPSGEKIRLEVHYAACRAASHFLSPRLCLGQAFSLRIFSTSRFTI